MISWLITLFKIVLKVTNKDSETSLGDHLIPQKWRYQIFPDIRAIIFAFIEEIDTESSKKNNR